MARYTGKSVLKNVYNVSDYHPLDTRMLVPTYADLTLESNWLVNGESNAYNGLIVAVGSNKADYTKNGIYFLFDKNNPGKDDIPEVTKEENWHKLASLSELSEVISQLQSLETELEGLGARLTAVEEKQTSVFGYRTDFPTTGSEGRIYVAVDEQKSYVWINNAGYIGVGEDLDKIVEINGGTAVKN
jgi:hypothetical protein